MLSKLQARVDFELVVITNTRPELPASNLRWTFHPWNAMEEPLLSSKFDIGIMPLIDDQFQKGKCALKLLQYMAAGLPTVASPVGVNADVVQEGVTGMLARSDLDWHRALECLISNDNLRAEMGRAGRALCEQQYSIKRWLPVLMNIFEVVQKETCKAQNK
jgi:glycosyltransferase involved in cell wall biosynthesis